MNGYRKTERERLIDLWLTSEGEERTRILARLVILDEQIERKEAENLFENPELMEVSP